MTVLSSAVISAGVRSGKYVRYYETVQELLASTVSMTVDEIVRTPRYEYRVVSSGEHLTTASGVKLECIANPYVTPDQFGAPNDGSDETTHVQAAFDSGLPVYLSRYYLVTSVHLPARNGVTIVGAGPYWTGLKGTDTNAPYIFQTFDPDDTADYRGQHHISNFGVIGRGQRAVVIAQCINSSFDTIHLISSNGGLTFPNSYIGVEQFIFEEAFGNVYTNFHASSVATGTCSFKVNATCLDSIFNLMYCNSVIDLFNLDIDSGRREVANTRNGGFGHLTFNKLTAQGARRYGVKVIANQGPIVFNSIYLENTLASMFIAGTEVFVNDTVFYVAAGGANHCIWVDAVDTATPRVVQFKGCVNINDKKVIIGNANDVQFIGGRAATVDGTWHDDVERASTNYAFSAFDGSRTMVSVSEAAIIGSGRGTAIGVKCVGSGGKHTLISVDESGVISAETPYTFNDTTEVPRTVVCGFFGTSSPTAASGISITPIMSRGIGGLGGTITFGVSGNLPDGVSINTETGTISGTPTETGVFSFRVTATDGVEVALSRTCTLSVS